jgi:hypothetical protein
MEYDDVAAQVASAALINGSEQIQGVPIKAADASQSAGAVPNRGGTTTAQQGQPAQQGQGQSAQSATDTAGKAINKASDTKTKLKGLWDQVKTTSKPNNP